MKYGFLNTPLILYVCTGITTGILCCITLTLLKYNKNLDRWTTELSHITVKAVKMKLAIENMNRVMTELRSVYPAFGLWTSRESLLAAADDIRQVFRGSVMTIGDMTRSGNELVLPMTLRIEGISYENITTCIGYLQTHMMPYISFGQISVERPEAVSGKDRWTCTLNIFLRIYDDGLTQ